MCGTATVLGHGHGHGQRMAGELRLVQVLHQGHTPSASPRCIWSTAPAAIHGSPSPCTVPDPRIADTRFVLDQLAVPAAGRNPDAPGRPLPKALGQALDLRQVGIYGHSVGGTTAAQAMYEDRRIGVADGGRAELPGRRDRSSGIGTPGA
ncbi:hypothetical protein OIU91_39370 [Streptomyces sp. NBC_01456]|uniref:hypothetical protein n=1 Tax=unclassified Streptomyces TaxID=2593676 RepID=UPI002E330B06|nr:MULTISPECIES: hypothetical protein [unclassified Streptomyces]